MASASSRFTFDAHPWALKRTGPDPVFDYNKEDFLGTPLELLPINPSIWIERYLCK